MRAWLIAFLLFISPVHAMADEVTWEVDSLVIETRDGERHEFTVELAVSPEQRSRGLMHRESLDPDAGMLFLHSRDQLLTMWMRNTLIPLDMLFLDREGRIVSIAERAVPLSERTISSGRPARAVLEVAGGTVDRLGLRRGDRVLHDALN